MLLLLRKVFLLTRIINDDCVNSFMIYERMKKLAIITSHPIQYNAPLFRLLTERRKVLVKVFYTWGQTKDGLVYDPDFNRSFKWDIPLLEGYEAVFIENVSEKPNAGTFNGIKNNDLIKQVDAWEPDTLLVFGWSFHSHLQVLRHYKGGKKILFRGDSTLLDEPPGFSIKKVLRRTWLRWVYRHIDVALYTGEDNKAYFLKHGLDKKQLVYAPHAVDNSRFADPEADEKAKFLRKELNIPVNAFVYLFAGKLESKKDPLLLIRSFQRISESNVRLLIVGNGALEEEAKRMASGDSRILFLDFQNQQQMPVIYRLGDVFVLPSRGPGETWGLSVNEAMACGRAVLVSDRCGCAKELVKENGLVFCSDSEDDLLRSLIFFTRPENDLTLMGQSSKTLIHFFSYTKIAMVIESIV